MTSRHQGLRIEPLLAEEAPSCALGTPASAAAVKDVNMFVRAAEGDDVSSETMPTTDDELEVQICELTNAIDLDEKGAAAQSQSMEPPINVTLGEAAGQIVRNIPYIAGSSVWKNALDVYLPHIPTDDAARLAQLRRQPLVIHIHGGGWVRGDRAHNFYGAPGISAAFAKMGFVTVAPSYRLGEYPHFLTDVVLAILWSIKSLHEGLRGAGVTLDPTIGNALANGIILSGHSAGAHIVSTLTTCTALLKCLDDTTFGAEFREVLPKVLRGIVLVSGIYTLRNPFSKCFKNWRKCVFDKIYMNRAFIPFGANLDELSPAFCLASLLEADDPHRQELWKATKLDAALQCRKALEVPCLLRVPVAILSAASDLGLEYDAGRFSSLVQRAKLLHSIPSHTQWITVPSTSHATICVKSLSHSRIAEAVTFILSHPIVLSTQ
jgi:hypothetical protein